MNSKLRIVIAGRDKDFLAQIEPLIRDYFGCEPILQHITNGHADPLHNHPDEPDLLVLDLASDWNEQLSAIWARPVAARPTMLVIGPATNIDAMRLAMRAGASDYLARPVDPSEFVQALSLIEKEERQQDPGSCIWTSVMGVKGGIGASMLACNLGYLVSQDNSSHTLIDLHLQSGSLASYLDLEPRNSFQDAIDAAHDLDSIAVEGYMTKTSDGLKLLASPMEQIVLAEQIPADSLHLLFDLITSHYRYAIVDLPCYIDSVVASAIDRTDLFCLVMEQSVVALRETLRLVHVLNTEFGINESQIRIVVNRFSKHASVSEKHIRMNLGELETFLIPNDFRTVSESLDIGIPVVRHARNSAAAKALVKLGAAITGRAPERETLVSSLTSMLRS